jgi:uncharacterized protein
MKEGYKIILAGIVGSKAYNLDTEISDTDVKGVYVAPMMDFFKHGGVPEVTTVSADESYYELQKFVNMASKGNPTALELLFLPEYMTLLPEGTVLRDERKSFLTSVLRYTYGGYSKGQFEEAKTFEEFSPKYQKKVRHAFRLLLHGKQLLTTGDLTVRLSEGHRTMLFELGKMPMSKLERLYEHEEEELMIVKTELPKEPDYDSIDAAVAKIRNNFERI